MISLISSFGFYAYPPKSSNFNNSRQQKIGLNLEKQRSTSAAAPSKLQLLEACELVFSVKSFMLSALLLMMWLIQLLQFKTSNVETARLFAIMPIHSSLSKSLSYFCFIVQKKITWEFIKCEFFLGVLN